MHFTNIFDRKKRPLSAYMFQIYKEKLKTDAL
jgi:hypothetical protein